MKFKVIAFLVFLLVAGYLFINRPPEQEQAEVNPENPEVTVTQESAPLLTSPSASEVAVLSEEETIRQFIKLVGDKEIDQAIGMMVTGEGEQWRSYLNSFESISLLDVEKNELGSFQVNLDVVMKPESAQGPIPYLGYDNGENIKFINLLQENGVWKVEGVATGP